MKTPMKHPLSIALLFALHVTPAAFCTNAVLGQSPPYDVAPDAEPPYFRVRYEASTNDGELDLPVTYTAWIPDGTQQLRGVIVHQHGCGVGSAKSGMTGAYDLHWQRLAAEHHCALVSASYEVTDKDDCGRWCLPQNGSGTAFIRSLTDLGELSQHPELATVPWALWGHSGGAVWTGTMAMLYPDRTAAVWMRSGGPTIFEHPAIRRGEIIPIPEAAYQVPMMINIGTEEGVTVREGRHSQTWSYTKKMHQVMRKAGGLISISVDPLSGHACGNQRYLAIPWMDACLTERLPQNPGESCRLMPSESAWLAPLSEDLASVVAVAKDEIGDAPNQAIWLPNEGIAKAWMAYVKDTKVPDTTAPPAPERLRIERGVLAWDAKADLQSGIQRFIIYRHGKQIGSVPTNAKNRFGRPLFQGLVGSDTPVLPLRTMTFKLPPESSLDTADYRVVSVNTADLTSDQ